jgi:hypothetical protein
MARATSKSSTNPSAFLNSVALSHLFRDPFVAAAFKAAEDDGLEPGPVHVDQPKVLDGGATERVLDMVEA